MEQLWSAEALRTHWVLTSAELELLKGMSARRSLVVGYYLKFFQRYGRFPQLSDAVPAPVAAFLGEQVGYGGPLPARVPDRTDRYYRRLIIDHLRLRRFDRSASARFRDWLVSGVLPEASQVSTLEERVTAWFLKRRFIRPPQARLDKLLAQAERQFERVLYNAISSRLSPVQKLALAGESRLKFDLGRELDS